MAFSVTRLVPELALKSIVVRPAAPFKAAVRPVAPVWVIDVIAVFTAVSVRTPVPDKATVRRAVSVNPARVVFAVITVFNVATLLPLSVMTPSEPPPRFSARLVGLPVVRP